MAQCALQQLTSAKEWPSVSCSASNEAINAPNGKDVTGEWKSASAKFPKSACGHQKRKTIFARPDQILMRHKTDIANKAAIRRIIAIIAHHEIMPLRHFIHAGIVSRTAVSLVKRHIRATIGQRLAEATNFIGGALRRKSSKSTSALALMARH